MPNLSNRLRFQTDDINGRVKVLMIHRNFEHLYPLLCLLDEDLYRPKIQAAEHLAEGLRALSHELFDLIIFDSGVDQRGIYHVIEALQDAAPYIPLVMTTPAHYENKAEDLLNRGLMDYILEDKDYHAGVIKRILRTALFNKQSDDHIAELINFDHLTGLANRFLFRDRLDQAILRAHRNQHIIALLFIDLDHLHQINTEKGFDIGDELLIACSQRITNALRRQDAISRLGGDEFGALLENIHRPEDAGFIAQHLIEEFKVPFIIQHESIDMNLSIGIAFGAPEHPFDPATLMKQSDIARYRAKERGGKCFEYFSVTHNQSAIDEYNACPDLQIALQRIFTADDDNKP